MANLKTAWLNLQDGLGNRFSWSHVKAVYYNWSTKKLLSTKLDEIDTLIDTKIAKAMMTNQQVNDSNKVPTSALTYSMQQQINQLNSDLDNYITIDSARIGDWMVLQKRSGVISVTIRTVRPNGGLVADKLVILPETIPVGFRPQDVTYAYCKLLQGNNISMWGTLLFQFYPDGLIKFVSSQNVNVDIEIDGSTSWITG